jgi:hypothetical protein
MVRRVLPLNKFKCLFGFHDKTITGKCPVTSFKVWECKACGKNNRRKHSAGSRFN